MRRSSAAEGPDASQLVAGRFVSAGGRIFSSGFSAGAALAEDGRAADPSGVKGNNSPAGAAAAGGAAGAGAGLATGALG